MARYKGPVQGFGWGGVGFDVPVGWNLAEYKVEKRVWRVELEDDYEPRLFFEWTVAKQALSGNEVERRFLKQSRPLAEKSKQTEPYEGLGAGWTGRCYVLADGSRIVVAYVIAEGRKFFGLLQLYFPVVSRDEPRGLTELVTGSFKRYRDVVRWRVYDVDLEVPGHFGLLETQLASGRKLLVFHRGMRKLWVWTFSLADVVLGERSPASFAAYFLNLQASFAPLTWYDEGERVRYRRRRWRYPLGAFDELGRGCRRYTAHVWHDVEGNVLRIWVYNYRRAGDLADVPREWLPGALQVDLLADEGGKVTRGMKPGGRRAAGAAGKDVSDG